MIFDVIAAVLAAVSAFVLATVDGPWLYPLVFAVTVADAFFIVIPSETVVVALGAMALSTGQPNALILIGVAAVGAMAGDSLTYWLARRLDLRRFRWVRGPKIASSIDWASRALDRRAASVLLTARFIPFGRIIVNLTAGTTRFPYPRFLLLTVVSGMAWAAYNVLIGAFFGQLFAGNALLAVGVSVVAAVAFGLVIDAVVAKLSGERSRVTRAAVRPAPAS